MKGTVLMAAAALAATTGGGFAQDAAATLMNRDGEETGTVTMTSTASGQMYLVISATDVPEGIHGVHVHETGDCSAADFASAGGHLAGDAQHGVLVEGGPHPGDFPNAHVQSDGVLAVEAFDAGLSLDAIFDDDGAAFVIHSGADDYESQPAGDAGDRIACGVFEQG